MALRTQPGELLMGKSNVIEEDPPFLKQLLFPDPLDNQALRMLHKAARADMSGDYDTAEKVLKDLKSDRANQMNGKAEIIVKLATVLDNAGKSKESIDELRKLVESDKWMRLPSDIYDWIRYHLALADRRLAENNPSVELKDLKEVQTKFKTIHDSTKNVRHRAACKHQLGVVSWIKSQNTLEKNVAEKERKNARNYFLKAAESWKAQGNFREGYSLRRLAELEVSEGKARRAVELLLGALEIFARHGCDKYQKEVRAKLVEFLLKAPD